MKYGVIINTYGRPVELVERSLKAALNQNTSPTIVTIIDQNPSPMYIGREIFNDARLHYQRFPTKRLSLARNNVETTRNIDWYVFCDDDGYMAEDYSSILYETIQNNPSVEVIAGSIIREDNFKFYTKRQEVTSEINNFRNTKLLMGSNYAVKRKTFEELGRLDEDFGVGSYWGSGEETDFAWKAYFSKKKMIYVKNLVVFHPPPYIENFSASLKKSYSYGLGKGALVAKWLILKRKPIVLYEAMEMTIIPIFKLLLALITLRLKGCILSLCSLAGRYAGFFKYIFK